MAWLALFVDGVWKFTNMLLSGLTCVFLSGPISRLLSRLVRLNRRSVVWSPPSRMTSVPFPLLQLCRLLPHLFPNVRNRALVLTQVRRNILLKLHHCSFFLYFISLAFLVVPFSSTPVVLSIYVRVLVWYGLIVLSCSRDGEVRCSVIPVTNTSRSGFVPFGQFLLLYIEKALEGGPGWLDGFCLFHFITVTDGYLWLKFYLHQKQTRLNNLSDKITKKWLRTFYDKIIKWLINRIICLLIDFAVYKKEPRYSIHS